MDDESGSVGEPGESGSVGETGREPVVAVLAVCCLLVVVFAAVSLTGIYSPLVAGDDTEEEAAPTPTATPTPTKTPTAIPIPTETPSPAPTTTATSTPPPPTPTPTPSPTPPPSPSPSTSPEPVIDLLSDPIPGKEVTAQVVRGGNPVVDAWVSFNGEVVGRTDERGLVAGVVPYEEELVIEVNESRPGGNVGVPSLGSGRTARVGDPTAILDSRTNDSVIIEVPTTIEIDEVGSTVDTVLLNASIEHVPVENATVVVENESAGETGADGLVTVEVTPGENVTVEAERGDAYGNTSIELPAVELSVESTPTVPWRETPVSVTAGGDPAANVPVLVDGQVAGTTGEDGRVTVSLPAALSATVAAGEDGTYASTTVRPLLAPLAALAVLALVVGIALGRSGSGGSVRRLLARPIRDGLVLILALGSRLDVLLSAALPVVRRVLAGTMGFPEAGRRLVASLAGSWRGLVGALGGLLAAVLGTVRGGDRGPVEASGPDRGSDPVSIPDVEDISGAPAEVTRKAWYRLVELSPVSRPHTRTPAEIARGAVDAGLPDAPVRTVLEAFRDLEYGERTPDPGDADEVRRSARQMAGNDGDGPRGDGE